jgi:hypothetical protein
MNIGEEDEPIEVPMPVNPRRIRRETPVPVEQPAPAQPAKVPAQQAMYIGTAIHQHVESFQEWIDAAIEVDQ